MNRGLPNTWCEASLAELLTTLESGSRPRGGVRGIQNGIPSVGGEHLTYDGGFDFHNIKYIPRAFAQGMNRGRIQCNDILIVKDGATTGKTSFIDSQFPFGEAFVNEHVFICRPTPLVEPRFVFRYCQSLEGQSRILDNFKGSAQGGINQSFAPNTCIPIAPINEQRRIVAKLDALLERVNDCQKRRDKIPIILKRFRQSVLAAACSGRLTEDWRTDGPGEAANTSIYDDGELPYKWELKTVDNLADIGSGQSSKDIIASCKPRADIPWFRVGDMNRDGNERYMITGENYLTSDDVKRLRLRVYQPGTIIFPKRGGAIYTNKKRVLCNQSCLDLNTMALTANGCSSEYLWVWFCTINLGQLSNGSNVPQINNPDILPLRVPVPPPDEQREIVGRVEALFNVVDGIETRYEKTMTHVDRLDQSILAKAFRGELVPQDPNDEPASVLLERIRVASKSPKNRAG